MSKSSLITVLAIIASVSAKPYYYGYGTYPYATRAAYSAAELYNPAVSTLPATYPAGYPTYSSYPASYPAPLSGAYAAPLSVSAYSNTFNLEELTALYNRAPVAPVAPVATLAPVAPVAPVTYAGYTSPYSYYYKR